MEEAKPKFIFNCQRCERCCERDISIYLNDIERWSKDGTIYQVFPSLTISAESMAVSLNLEKEDGKCKMYDPASKECKIYNSCPIVCRAYPLMHDGSGFLLRDKDCPGLNKGEMTAESLDEMRKAAIEENEDEKRTATILPMLQAILMGQMAKKSEEAYSKLSEEEKAKLEEIFKKKE